MLKLCYVCSLGFGGHDSCLFGDIMNLVPEDMRKEIEQPTVVHVVISADDVQRAFKGKPVDKFFTKEGRLKCVLGEAGRDFKLLCASPRDTQSLPTMDDLNLSEKKFSQAKKLLEARLPRES